MNAIEKAKEIFNRCSTTNCPCKLCQSKSKENAIVIVEGFLEWKDWQQQEMVTYWTEVKHEIEKL